MQIIFHLTGYRDIQNFDVVHSHLRRLGLFDPKSTWIKSEGDNYLHHMNVPYMDIIFRFYTMKGAV